MKPAKKGGSYRRNDVHAAVGCAKRLLRIRTRRAIYVTVGFILSCASVVLFSDGFPLHSYWQSLGRFFLLLWMALLVPFVVIVGLAIDAWVGVREMEKIEE